MTTHNKSKSKEYRVWRKIYQQTQDKNAPGYRYVGGKGITLNPAWKNFLKFLEDMGHIPENCNTISLKDNTSEYNKQNCFWDFKTTGRPKKNLTEVSRFIHIGIDKKMSDFLDEVSKRESKKRKKTISANDMVKSILDKYKTTYKYEFDDFIGDKNLSSLVQRFKKNLS